MIITQNAFDRARARAENIEITPEPGTSFAFESVGDEKRAIAMCFEELRERLATADRETFEAGWAAQRDMRDRETKAFAQRPLPPDEKPDVPDMSAIPGVFAASWETDKDDPPIGPIAAQVRWYAQRAGFDGERRESFLRGWNGGALWVNENVPTVQERSS
jgi:hypothetical protein